MTAVRPTTHGGCSVISEEVDDGRPRSLEEQKEEDDDELEEGQRVTETASLVQRHKLTKTGGLGTMLVVAEGKLPPGQGDSVYDFSGSADSSSADGDGAGSGGSGGGGAGSPSGHCLPRTDPRDDIVLDVECGLNKATLYLNMMCSGSKGVCVLHDNAWMTPNEFQFISGRETAKDWKRSIKHFGKSLKLLIAKGVLSTQPPVCRCEMCHSGSPASTPGKDATEKAGTPLKSRHEADETSISSGQSPASVCRQHAGKPIRRLLSKAEAKGQKLSTALFGQLSTGENNNTGSDGAGGGGPDANILPDQILNAAYEEEEGGVEADGDISSSRERVDSERSVAGSDGRPTGEEGLPDADPDTRDNGDSVSEGRPRASEDDGLSDKSFKRTILESLLGADAAGAQVKTLSGGGGGGGATPELENSMDCLGGKAGASNPSVVDEHDHNNSNCIESLGDRADRHIDLLANSHGSPQNSDQSRTESGQEIESKLANGVRRGGNSDNDESAVPGSPVSQRNPQSSEEVTFNIRDKIEPQSPAHCTTLAADSGDAAATGRPNECRISAEAVTNAEEPGQPNIARDSQEACDDQPLTITKVSEGSQPPPCSQNSVIDSSAPNLKSSDDERDSRNLAMNAPDNANSPDHAGLDCRVPRVPADSPDPNGSSRNPDEIPNGDAQSGCDLDDKTTTSPLPEAEVPNATNPGTGPEIEDPSVCDRLDSAGKEREHTHTNESCPSPENLPTQDSRVLPSSEELKDREKETAGQCQDSQPQDVLGDPASAVADKCAVVSSAYSPGATPSGPSEGTDHDDSNRENGEHPLRPENEARLLNVIAELKNYKRHLIERMEVQTQGAPADDKPPCDDDTANSSKAQAVLGSKMVNREPVSTAVTSKDIPCTASRGELPPPADGKPKSSSRKRTKSRKSSSTSSKDSSKSTVPLVATSSTSSYPVPFPYFMPAGFFYNPLLSTATGSADSSGSAPNNSKQTTSLSSWPANTTGTTSSKGSMKSRKETSGKVSSGSTTEKSKRNQPKSPRVKVKDSYGKASDHQIQSQVSYVGYPYLGNTPLAAGSGVLESMLTCPGVNYHSTMAMYPAGSAVRARSANSGTAFGQEYTFDSAGALDLSTKTKRETVTESQLPKKKKRKMTYTPLPLNTDYALDLRKPNGLV